MTNRSSFAASCPESTEDFHSATASPAAGTEIDPKRILVVDDDPVVRYLVASILKQAGNLVDTAADGEAAWEALNADDYALLVTDYLMPRVSGLALVSRIRDTEMNLPIIMISGATEDPGMFHEPWNWIDVHLPKPFVPTALLTAVSRLLATSYHHTDSRPSTSFGHSQNGLTLRK